MSSRAVWRQMEDEALCPGVGRPQHSIRVPLPWPVCPFPEPSGLLTSLGQMAMALASVLSLTAASALSLLSLAEPTHPGPSSQVVSSVESSLAAAPGGMAELNASSVSLLP